MERIIIMGIILQTAGSILLVGGYLPQILKLHRTKTPTGISLLFWMMIGTGCTLVLANMIIQNSPSEVVVTQTINAIGAWYTLLLIIYYKKKRDEGIVLPSYVNYIILSVIVVIGYSYMLLDREQFGHALQTIGTIALLIAYIPQIIYLNRVKDATGISKWLFITLATGLLLVTGNMIITGTSIGIIVTEFINVTLIAVLYVMTEKYQEKTS